MSKKPKIACSLEPELAFLKNVKGVSTVFNRIFGEIFRGLAEIDSDRLAAWTALVNGDLEVEIAIRPKQEHGSKPKRSRPEQKPSSKATSMKKEDEKTLLHDLVGKFENFEPGS